MVKAGGAEVAIVFAVEEEGAVTDADDKTVNG